MAVSSCSVADRHPTTASNSPTVRPFPGNAPMISSSSQPGIPIRSPERSVSSSAAQCGQSSSLARQTTTLPGRCWNAWRLLAVSVFSLLTGPFVVPLGNESVLEVVPRQDALLACLRVGVVRISLIDAAKHAAYADPCGRAAAVVALRQSVRTDAPLVLRPEPRRATDLAPVAPYEIQLGRGERVKLSIANGELRVPLATLVSLPESTPIAP